MTYRHQTSLLLAIMATALATSGATRAPGPRGTAASGSTPPADSGASAHPTNAAQGVLYANHFRGGDIGVRVNNAIAALPGGCGTVVIPAGTYIYATKIVKPRCVRLMGEGAGTGADGRGGTVLLWTPKTGTALAIGDKRGGTTYPIGSIADLTIQGPGADTPTYGLWLGGDPADSVLPRKDFAESQGIRNVRITGFGTGVEWGNNAWVERFYHDEIFANGSGIGAADGATNTAEQNTFIAVSVFNNAKAAVAADEDFHFIGTSFDFNGAPSVGANYTDCHFEQDSGLFIRGEFATIIGGMAYLDATKGSDTALFFANGSAPGEWYIAGLEVGSNHPVREALEWSLPADSKLFITDLRGSGGGRIGAVTNAPYMYGSYVNADLSHKWRTPVQIGATLDAGAAEFRNSTQGGAWNIKLDDDWENDPEPYKYLQSKGGDFSILDSSATKRILSLTDRGTLSWGGGTAIRSSTHTGGGPIVLARSPNITGVPDLPPTYRAAGHLLNQPSAPGTLALTRQLPLAAVTASIGARPLAAGECITAKVAVPGASGTGVVALTPDRYPGNGIYWEGFMARAGIAVVKVCASVASTPAPTRYRVRVLP